MSNHESFFKSFSFYLFKSFFLPNDLQLSLELKLHLQLEFDLDLQLEYQMCAKYTPQSNGLVLIMLVDQSKTKLRSLNHL